MVKIKESLNYKVGIKSFLHSGKPKLA